MPKEKRDYECEGERGKEVRKEEEEEEQEKREDKELRKRCQKRREEDNTNEVRGKRIK